MDANAMQTNRHQMIRQLFDEYIEMYASRDERLHARFSENFSGFAGSSDVLVKNKPAWLEVTHQDFAQVPERIRIEMLDLSIQDLCEEVAVVTAFFHIHLPGDHALFAKEVARLVLVLRQESGEWKIAHSSISIPYRQASEGEV
jgi:ketosteroid isomerase-like protein